MVGFSWAALCMKFNSFLFHGKRANKYCTNFLTTSILCFACTSKIDNKKTEEKTFSKGLRQKKITCIKGGIKGGREKEREREKERTRNKIFSEWTIHLTIHLIILFKGRNAKRCWKECGKK